MEFNKNKIKTKIAISKIKEENDIVMEKKKTRNILKTVVTAIAGIILSAGFVFAGTAVYERVWKTPEKIQLSSGNYEEITKVTEESKKENISDLMSGMMAIKFTEPTDSTEGKDEKVSDSSKNDWYNYSEKKWANAKTNDGSMWVWIPRYAYKINKSNQTFDVVFLVGTTDNYYDKDGKLQTAKRQTSETDVPDATKEYVVHPAFTNESNIGYVNGGWKKELTGIWVSKFEAGYAGGNNNADKVDSKIKYSQENVWASGYETKDR